jgi:hypothetical protein
MSAPPTVRQHSPLRLLGLALIPAASLVYYLSMSPFAGDPCYHQFADARKFIGIPNFLDVLSNLPFLLVGIAGIWTWTKHPPAEAPFSWLTFHLGVTCVALGSSYYHWNPYDASLVWDRLPMTLGFVGLSLAMIAETVHPAFDRHPLLPALLLAFSTVFYWYLMHDLRLYLWVQTLPLLLVPAVVFLFPGGYTHQAYLFYALILYAAAKFAEAYDRQIFELLGGRISGHTIKHLLAAGSCLVIVLMLRRRQVTGIHDQLAVAVS